MAPFCAENGIGLLTYGTVGGGLLSGRYLGAQEPGRPQLNTASLHKYKQMIDAWGGWSLFQRLLTALDAIAKRRDTTIANVAVRYVLDRPAVAGVIIGARLGVSEHIAEAQHIESLRLETADVEEIDGVLAEGNDLYALIGDCGDEYRR
jgi:aryl-alcohol dehydrogenase-like predicted oxidoreductase